MGAITLQRILIADDEPDILEIARIALEMVGGYEVAICNSGAELLDRLPVFDPDLVVIDVLMPDMEGLEVLERIRDVPGYQAVPVVFLTGVAKESEIESLRRSGAAAIINKPFDPMTLAERIDSVWKTARGE